MKHTEYRIFTIFNYEEEERWINEKASKGELLTDIGFFRYVFEDGEPRKYIYRLEMLENITTHYKSIEYLRFLEETGIECIGSILKWVVLRRKASDGPFDIYSDIDSKIKHYRRIINFASIPMYINLIVSVPNILCTFRGSDRNYIFILNLVLAILLYIGNLSLKKKVNRLQKEKYYRE